MPQLLPAAAAWAAAAWSSAVTATAVGLTNVGVMAAIGEGATIALAGKIVGTAATLALSAAATAIMRPNTPSTGTTLDFKPDPKAPVRGAMGYTAVGGNKAFQATWGYNRVAMSLGVALSLGPIDAVTQFQADGSAVAFTGAQGEATGFYAKDMWQSTTLGLPGDAALLPPTGFKYGTPGLTGWGSQHAAPQVSFAFWTMLLAKNPEDRDVYTNGVPDPRWIGRWMKVWNPRRDDTYPGGSGPQRRDDWRTWEWSENPYVHALAWYRGHFKLNLDGTIDRTKRIAGIGAPDAALDIPAFVEGMNVADANQWTISGEWASTDPKAQVAMAMLQAGGGQPINRGAQISVLVNMPRVSTYTYTKADLIGQATIRPLTPRRDRKNTIIPRFKSEANNWEYVAAGEVSDAGYRAEDRDEPRSVEVEYVHVRNAKQAGQLAAYDLVTLREGLTATLPSKVHLMHVHAGDCITVDEPELAMVGQKFVVMRTTTDYKSATVTLELRSETDAKHAFALGQVAKAPPSPTLSAVDPTYMPPPVAIDWTIAPRPPAPDGTSQPVIVIEGKVETSDIASVIIEYGLSVDGPWAPAYSGPPSANGRYEATGLAPTTDYWISVRYVAKNGATSDRYIDGPYTAPTLTAGISDETLDQIVEDVAAQIDADIGEGLQAGRDALERARQNALLILQNATNALGGVLNEERDRETAADDLQNRLNIAFLIDPVAKTGIVRQDVVFEGTNETIVETSTRLIARTDDAVAGAVFQMTGYADEKVALATADLVTGAQVDNSISAASLTLRSYADDKVAEGTAGLATVSAVDDSIAAASLTLKSYADDQVAEGVAGLATSASVGNAIAASELLMKTYADESVSTATAELVTAAEMDDAIGVARLAMEGYADGKIASATAGLVTASELAGALAGADLALKTWTDGQIATSTALLASKAEVDTRGNALPNSTGANGWAGWEQNANWYIATDGTWGARFETTAGGTAPNQSAPFAVQPSAAYVLSADLYFAAASGAVAVDVVWETSGGGFLGYSSRVFTSSGRDYGQRISVSVSAPSNAGRARVRFFSENVSGGGVGVRRIKLERGALPATAWTDEATDLQLSATAALALDTATDVLTKMSEARVRLVAAASGGNPAVVELFSDSAGASFVRLGAKQIGFGDSTTFDDATDQLRTITNGVRRVIAWGASFGTDGSLTEWEGPTSVAYAAMSRSNAFYYRANVAPHFGGSALPGQGFHAQADAAVRLGSRTSPGLVTTSTLRITVSGATGPVIWESAVMGGADDWVVTNASGTVSGTYFETAFRASVSTPGEQKRGQFAFLVTDTGSGKSFTIPAAGAAIYNV